MINKLEQLKKKTNEAMFARETAWDAYDSAYIVCETARAAWVTPNDDDARKAFVAAADAARDALDAHAAAEANYDKVKKIYNNFINKYNN